MRAKTILIILFMAVSFLLGGCAGKVPHEDKYGIYSLDSATGDIALIYGTSEYISAMRLNHAGDAFVFVQGIGGDKNEYTEICTVGVDGTGYARLTGNAYWDLYPAWSPDDTHIAFLSMRERDLDIYTMSADGSDVVKLYDSGYHDADIHWAGNRIAFTSGSKIWTIRDDGTGLRQITDPADAGVWGNTNLPIGDYDPQFSPDGSKIVFERLENAESQNGDYNFFIINADGTDETRLTDDGYAQGIASWSHGGDRLVYVVAAIEGKGKYDIWTMNADGTGNQDITPGYFPESFLCHAPNFSKDDSLIYFIGEWWSD
jgi:Tol biopolymer transport system component